MKMRDPALQDVSPGGSQELRQLSDELVRTFVPGAEEDVLDTAPRSCRSTDFSAQSLSVPTAKVEIDGIENQPEAALTR